MVAAGTKCRIAELVCGDLVSRKGMPSGLNVNTRHTVIVTDGLAGGGAIIDADGLSAVTDYVEADEAKAPGAARAVRPGPECGGPAVGTAA